MVAAFTIAASAAVAAANATKTLTLPAGAALAAPYEVAGPDVPKPHERTAIQELSAYLGKRVAGTVRIGGRDGASFAWATCRRCSAGWDATSTT